MKRRKFFQVSSAGVAGLALGSSCKSTGDKKVVDQVAQSPSEVPDYRKTVKTEFTSVKPKPASDKVILALIGAGGWGTNLILEAANAGENILIKYVCDVDDTRGGRAIAELEKIQGFKPIAIRDMRKVYDDKEVDGVFVETPEHWHALATIWGCQAGKDVYVEKTVSHSIFEGQQMIKAAMKYERIVQCGMQNRSADYAITARDYIKSGELGDIVSVHVRELLDGPVPLNEKENTAPPDTIDWNMWLGPAPEVPYNVSRNKSWGYYWDYSGGYVTSGGSIHQLDMARMVLGFPDLPKSAYCSGGRYAFNDNRDVPDYQMTTFDYGNWVMTLETGECTPYMQKSGLDVRFGTIYPKWMENATRVDILGTKRIMYLGRMGGGWQVFDKDEKLVAQDKGIFPLKAHILNYIDCIRTRKQPNGSIVEGHKSAVHIHLANLSYRAGNRQLLFSPEYEAIMNDKKAAELDHLDYRSGFEISKEV
ncbi:MAG TPA: Gfo/Idh/MocA family oxidoreductase [Bacteroidales bacterium]|nr:Gfo/Idh/MocA family oxidoreductase [Bacteroidales bacterium]